ncbi:MAG: type VI secretion system domain-containing protein, partial [Myxococcales bacterium]|nr:type VI secretion system domain-containing protein [Myxococcales bacterium]
PPAGTEPLAPFLRKTAEALLAAARPLAVTDPEGVRLWITALFLDLDRLPDTSEGQRTYIPAPRSIVLEELRAAAGDPERLARTARGAAEHAPFAFELHRRYHDALEALGAKDAAAVLRGALRALVARLPGLTELAFQDGTAFADASIRSWIGEAAPARVSSGDATSAEDDEPVGDDVPSALRLLGERAERARGRRRFTLRRRIAELYVQGRRPALAAAIYADLLAEADALALAAWDPEPLADVLAGYVRALRELSASPDAPPAPHQPDEILARLATLDPSAAFALA